MEYSTITLEVRENIGYLTLNRPDAANSMSKQMTRELMDAATELGQSPELRAVLISGAGRMFCSGGDIKEFNSLGEELPRHVQEVTTYLHAAVSRLVRLEVPVVAAVHGSAAGAGLPLACGADIVLAAESTRFTMAYTRIGLSPDGGSTFFLPRLVGLKRSLELALLNRVLSAQEALDWGIVTRVVPDADLFDEAQKTVSQLAAGPTAAFASAKRLMYAGWTASLETQLEQESRSITENAATSDAIEGISAFVEKRPATFKGQ
ncbi:MAG TPA: enoyl-CoA hydratase [Dehalococcoidia bacterium]|nr:enoyl-CoA hydratase [Dehalococcoidia bacterium]